MRRWALQAWSSPEAVLVEPDFLGALSVPVLGQPCVSLARGSHGGRAAVQPEGPGKFSGSDTTGDPAAEEQV